MSSVTTDLVVWGGGPGGYAAAFYAADLGMDVTLVDLDVNPGGVCLYRGCIPSKALLHVAKVMDEARELSHFGVEFAEPSVNLEKLKATKDDIVKKLTGGLGQLAKARKVKMIQGRGSLKNATSLSVEFEGQTQEVQFKNIIVATGSHPTPFPGLELKSDRIWDSTSALELNKIPKKLLVVGGGIIGLELGSVYATLGSQVTVVEMTPGILPGCDKDIAQILKKSFDQKMHEFLLETKVTSISEEKDGLRVSFELKDGSSKEEVFDDVLVSIGRRPNTKGIGLEEAGVELDPRGFVAVADNRQTNISGIYAIGDVTGNPMLAHKASHEARVAVDAIDGKRVAFAPQVIPSVVYTDPEIAWCGLTEIEAKEQGVEHQVVKFPWAASGRAMTLNRTEGLTKIIVNPKNDRILGVAIAGPGAGDLISEAVVAIEMSATVKDLALCIHPHPTVSETIMEAAELYYGHCTHMYRPKRKK